MLISERKTGRCPSSLHALCADRWELKEESLEASKVQTFHVTEGRMDGLITSLTNSLHLKTCQRKTHIPHPPRAIQNILWSKPMLTESLAKPWQAREEECVWAYRVCTGLSQAWKHELGLYCKECANWRQGGENSKQLVFISIFVFPFASQANIPHYLCWQTQATFQLESQTTA